MHTKYICDIKNIKFFHLDSQGASTLRYIHYIGYRMNEWMNEWRIHINESKSEMKAFFNHLLAQMWNVQMNWLIFDYDWNINDNDGEY